MTRLLHSAIAWICGVLFGQHVVLLVRFRYGGLFDHTAFLGRRPPCLNCFLPCVVELIFQDFKQNYRALESWNLKHRGETLRAVLRTDMRKAFQSLRPNTASTPDRFVETTVAQVVDVEADTCLVHVDHPLTPTSQVCWTLDDEPARVIPIHPQVLEVHSSIPLTPGQELCMHSQITEPADMHTHLQKFWMARWQKFAEVPAEQWNRLLGFCQSLHAFLGLYSSLHHRGHVGSD